MIFFSTPTYFFVSNKWMTAPIYFMGKFVYWNCMKGSYYAVCIQDYVLYYPHLLKGFQKHFVYDIWIEMQCLQLSVLSLSFCGSNGSTKAKALANRSNITYVKILQSFFPLHFIHCWYTTHLLPKFFKINRTGGNLSILDTLLEIFQETRSRQMQIVTKRGKSLALQVVHFTAESIVLAYMPTFQSMQITTNLLPV